MAAGNLLTEWSRLMMASFADAGVTDVVISPGSRSTPFVVAAARERRLRCHDAIDERAAAFFALGQARVSGRPSLLICTSGTAAAHYFPAIIEASQAHLPLIALTSDRPLELQDIGAPQTIDQIKLYGGYVRRFIELGTPEQSQGCLRALRNMAARAVSEALAPLPGPIHVNARARKPLDPVLAQSDEDRALSAAVTQLIEKPIVKVLRATEALDPAMLDPVVHACNARTRGLIVCGPGPLGQDNQAIFELARRTGFPVFPDVTSQLRICAAPKDVVLVDGFDIVMRTKAFRAQKGADCVLALGGFPVSSAWENHATPDAFRVVVSPYGWTDPQGSASVVLSANVIETARLLAARLEPKVDAAWKEFFTRAADAVARATAAELAQETKLTEGRVVRTTLDRAPKGSLLFLGNSLPIREADLYATRENDLGVLTQRGANGIDGLIATSAGVVASSAKPLTLLLGDVSFLHDIGSLILARAAKTPLVIVVVQNQGGRIFEQLPLASVPNLEPEVLAHVTTPHDVTFEHAGKLFGIAYHRVDSDAALSTALAAAHARNGATIIEAIVPHHGAREQQARVVAAVDALLVIA